MHRQWDDRADSQTKLLFLLRLDSTVVVFFRLLHIGRSENDVHIVDRMAGIRRNQRRFSVARVRIIGIVHDGIVIVRHAQGAEQLATVLVEGVVKLCKNLQVRDEL